MNVDNLTFDEKNTVLRFFIHRMGMETRHELMQRLPYEYNRMAGEEIVKVVIMEVNTK